MRDRSVRLLIVFSAIILILAGMVLYVIFDWQGQGKSKLNKYKNYKINDYVEVSPVSFDDYSDVYSSVNVSKVSFKDFDSTITYEFLSDEEDLIGYVNGYYKEIKANDNYSNNNTVSSNIKTVINKTVLSILYRLDFNLDGDIFEDNMRSYFLTTNIDLETNKVLSSDDLLSKYNYTKDYIAEKLYNEDVLISNSEVVVDKNTNISLTKSDIERKKDEYINRIISEFDNIINMYIENNSLVLVYDKRKINNLFFDNHFDTEIKIKYLK